MTDSIPSSFVNEYVLHLAASVGDADGVQAAIHSGADVNSLDAFGKSALLNAVSGEDWESSNSSTSFLTPQRLNTIRILLHSSVSLLTLNGPQSNDHGVTVLSLAAWLNLYPVVELLLQESSGRIFIDGVDSHGATPLMYATRDNSIDVTQLLLQNGARPDQRDSNHRSAIQYALSHPYVLFLSECALRRHRLQESKNASRSKLGSDNQKLVGIAEKWLSHLDSKSISRSSFTPARVSSRSIPNAIASRNLPLLLSLLFPTSLSSTPPLINSPDSQGWSPIHYCAAESVPSLPVLDSLYLAGADVSLFTSDEHYTPLHTLSLSRLGPLVREEFIEEFATHLVNDLRAPLGARDKNEETCIHLAAEHGDSRVLLALLKLDRTGTVRNQKNARGLSALDVARDEFRVFFGEAEILRSPSVVSQYTIRASSSANSLILPESRPSLRVVTSFPPQNSSPPSSDPAEALLHHLRALSLPYEPSSVPLSLYESSLHIATRLAGVVTTKSHARINHIFSDLAELRNSLNNVTSLHNTVSKNVAVKCRGRGIQPDPVPRSMGGLAAMRQSEDSEKTLIGSGRSRSSSIAQSEKSSGASSTGKQRPWTPAISPPALNDAFSSKIKSWIKQKIGPSMEKLAISKASNPEDGEYAESANVVPVPGEIKAFENGGSVGPFLPDIEAALKTSSIVLNAAGRDIDDIEKCLDTCDSLMRKASGYVDKTERALQKALKERTIQLEWIRPPPRRSPSCAPSRLRTKSSHSRLSPPSSPPSSPCPRRPTLTLQPSLSSLLSSASSSISHRSSAISLTSTIGSRKEREDDDVKLVRRLLMRKVEGSIEGALDEMEVALKWCKVVRDVLRDLARRAEV